MSEATEPTPETRQKIIDALCESFARDEMEMGELENRLELVHQAETAGELRLILADLPAPPVPVNGEGAASSPASDLPQHPTLPDDRIPDHSMIVGIMGGGGRSGTWIPARNNWAVGVMGGCEFDFRDAQLGAGVTEVRVVLAFMGAVEIIAPLDVQVESSGVGIISGFGISNHYRPPTHADAPILRVTGGVAFMGRAGVSVRNPGETTRDARHCLKAEQETRKLLERGGK
jgi:hypothetical protein